MASAKTLPGVLGENIMEKTIESLREVGADAIIGFCMDFEKSYVHRVGIVV